MKKFLLVFLLGSFAILSSSQTKVSVSKNQIPKDTVTLHHLGYKTLYSPTLDYPLLVEWWDCKTRVSCDQIDRKDQFAPDPLFEKGSDIQNEYDAANKQHKDKGLKGFDRGHMCPAADNQCPLKINGKVITAEKLQTECFYFTNMAPQYHSLNAGDWKKLEERTRDLASTEDSVHVWCGSVGSQEVIEGLHIPTKCWKVIYIKKTKTFECYIFNNTTDKPVGLDAWKVKKEDVEKLTGFKFNP